MDADYGTLALLQNATHEPHFHVDSATLKQRDAQAHAGVRGRLVAADQTSPVGMATFSVQDFDRVDRLWIDLAIHPDHRTTDTATQLIDSVIERTRPEGITSLWMPVREDYVDSWPNVDDLGFTEVHRTFGGGFFLADWQDSSRHTASVQVRALDPDDARMVEQARELYADVRGEKVVANPTIGDATENLDLDDIVAPASFLAFDNGTCVGLIVAAPSSLGAWLRVLAVRRDVRGQGIGRMLLASTLSQLQERDCPFLNTAGVRSDVAYLAVLRSLGATIEPDWIAFERFI